MVRVMVAFVLKDITVSLALPLRHNTSVLQVLSTHPLEVLLPPLASPVLGGMHVLSMALWNLTGAAIQDITAYRMLRTLIQYKSCGEMCVQLATSVPEMHLCQ